MQRNDRLLANLPLFHSFGYTAGMWYPLLRGMLMVTTPSPLEIKKNIAAVRDSRASVLLGTPTFLRGYLKKANADDFRTLRVAIAGAEKLDIELAKQWEGRFGSPVIEGFGLTECSPVVAANTLVNPVFALKQVDIAVGVCPGSAGRFLPGISYRVVSPDDLSKSVGKGKSGILLLRGVNIFSGYLNSGHNEERFTNDGWLNTGDVVRVDDDGFLHVVGRLSRFSKIGGEMVPHQAVEEAIGKALPDWGDQEVRSYFIGTRPCTRKGEMLVLLSQFEIGLGELKSRLVGEGIPNLWMPSVVKRVNRLPMLATGKLDLRQCLELCREDEREVGKVA